MSKQIPINSPLPHVSGFVLASGVRVIPDRHAIVNEKDGLLDVLPPTEWRILEYLLRSDKRNVWVQNEDIIENALTRGDEYKSNVLDAWICRLKERIGAEAITRKSGYTMLQMKENKTLGEHTHDLLNDVYESVGEIHQIIRSDLEYVKNNIDIAIGKNLSELHKNNIAIAALENGRIVHNCECNYCDRTKKTLIRFMELGFVENDEMDPDYSPQNKYRAEMIEKTECLTCRIQHVAIPEMVRIYEHAHFAMLWSVVSKMLIKDGQQNNFIQLLESIKPPFHEENTPQEICDKTPPLKTIKPKAKPKKAKKH